MHLLIPKLTPMQMALYLLALVVCWVFGGDTSSAVLYAIDPVTAAILIGGSVAAGAAPKIIEGIQQRRAMKRAAKSPEVRAQRRLEKQARRRLKKGKYGVTEAEKRQMGLEGNLEYTGQLSKFEADTKRGGGGQSPKDKRNMMKQIIEGTKNFMTKRRGDIEDLSTKVAATKRAADVGVVTGAAANRYAIEQGKAAANTAIGTGVAQGIGSGISMGTQAHGAGLFQKPDQQAAAAAAAQTVTNQTQPGTATNPTGTKLPVGAP